MLSRTRILFPTQYFRRFSSAIPQSLKIVNPATEEIIQELPQHNAEQIQTMLEKSRLAQLSWRKTPLSERINIMKKFHSLLTGPKVEEMALALTKEMGKPLSQAKGEINGTAARVQFFIDNVEKVISPLSLPPRGGVEENISWDPLGVIACISPWNYPYFVTSNVIIPALLTGNGVLFKPSEHATLSGLNLAELLYDSGLPQDLLRVVVGDGTTGRELARKKIDGLFFTGSVNTGRYLSAVAAEKLIKFHGELGGKDAAYVAPDAPIQQTAAALADGVCFNTGQGCCSVERIYVDQSIYKEFLDALVQEMSSFVIGDPQKEGTYIGPLVRKSQVDFLTQQVEDAVSKGGRVLIGGTRWKDSPNGKGFFFLPTVVADAREGFSVHDDESFGPIVAVSPVESEKEVIRRINSSPFGLTASVYSPNRDTATRVLSRLNVGSVYWNCCDRVSPQLPWSGRKDSGIGVSLSTEGIKAFVVPKAWHLNAPK